jgi:Glycosyltransferase sugar-binding region containing DXD motif
MMGPLRQIHFVFGLRDDFGHKPWSLVHHLAVRSAAECNGVIPTVWIHNEPEGRWWSETRSIARIDEIGAVWDDARHSPHHAHRADFARLAILARFGGAYLDCDVLSVKPLGDLWDGPACIGFQRGGYLCNGVIVAPPDDPFIRAWLGLFDDPHSPYRGTWDGFACRAPRELWESGKYRLRVEHESRFHEPSWTDPERLFLPSAETFPVAIAHHLWESKTWNRWLRDLTPASILAESTPFSRAARRFLG